MLKGFVAIRKYLVVGIAVTAPIVGVGCNECNTVATSPCAPIVKPTPCAPVVKPVRYARPAPCAPVVKPARCVKPAPCVQKVKCPRPAPCFARGAAPMSVSAPVVMSAAQPVYAQYDAGAPVVYQDVVAAAAYSDSDLAFGPASRAVTYKPVPSRSYADALSNVDLGDTRVVRNSAMGGSVVSSVVTPGDLAVAGIAYPAASAASVTYPVTAAGYVVADDGTVINGALLEGAVIADAAAPGYPVPVVAAGPARRPHQPRRAPQHRRRGAVETVAVQQRVNAGIPAGTPVYITPGGTTVSAYVPAPASGTYYEGAAPTGYLPVTERRGPHNAVVHYSTRSICKYDPVRGEDCVWTSGF